MTGFRRVLFRSTARVAILIINRVMLVQYSTTGVTVDISRSDPTYEISIVFACLDFLHRPFGASLLRVATYTSTVLYEALNVSPVNVQYRVLLQVTLTHEISMRPPNI